MTRPASPGSGRPPRLRAFWRAEDGSLTILGLLLFTMMLVAGGVALDTMRSERERTALQTTIDRGTLAATSLQQTRPGDEVMRDYLRAAGIPQDGIAIVATDNGFERSVSVDAMAVTPSLFMNALGVDQLVQPIRASAIEVRTEVELSLVVDISGSMADGDGQKIVKMREAAKEFVSKLLQGREERTFVSLVPYNEWVNIGSTMNRYFPLAATHNLSRCVIFSNDEFKRLDHPAGAPLTRKGHFDKNNSSNSLGVVARPECSTTDYAAVLPWSSNVTELWSEIDKLRAEGSTAINVGAKVGLLLLDPSSRARMTAMINDADLDASKRVDPVLLDHPVDYNTDGTHKVLVLMTDGVNNTQHDLKPEHKSGPSIVYVFQDRKNHACDNDGIPDDCPDFSASGPAAATHAFGSLQNPDSSTGSTASPVQPRYSFWSETQGQYYIHHTKTWADAPFGGVSVPDGEQPPFGAVVQNPSAPFVGIEVQNIGWQELLAVAPTKWLADNLLKDSGDTTMRNLIRNVWQVTHQSNTAADRNLADVCAAARAQGVIIYAISFQAPSGGRKAMQNCAGTANPDRYFDVQTLDIDTAFDDILASISRLRLTR